MSQLPRPLENLAKMLAYVLGRAPDEFGLVLAADGSLPLKQLLQALNHEPGWGFVRRHHLDQVVGLMRPPAFEVAEERIRCLNPQGLPERRPGEKPPPLLYLALPPKAHERVWQEGLKAPAGQELVLARSKETALKLGKRRAPVPILVTIQAQAAAKAGAALSAYGEELFLAEALPREFLQLPTPAPPEEKPKVPKAAPPQPTPGTFIVDWSQPPGKPSQRRGKKAEPDWKAGARALRKQRKKGERDQGAKGEKGKRGKG
jgi:putative RNA 2'-phosphotransferase